MKKLLAPLQLKVEEWKKNTSALEREHDKGQYHQTQTRNSCSHYISVIIQQNQTPHSVDYMYYMYMYICCAVLCCACLVVLQRTISTVVVYCV